MVVLLIGMAVAAVAMSATLPAWRQQMQREKEEELIYRGTQYARAIFLYNAKTGTFPNDIDVLVSQHYLRKKYLDPITGKDFVLIAGAPPGQGGAPAGGGSSRGVGPGTSTPSGGGAPAGPGRAGGTAPSGGVRPPSTTGSTGQMPIGGVSSSGGGQLVGGIQGVYSGSNATSIKIYKGAQEYDQWLFRYADVAAEMRGGGQGQAPIGAGNGRGGPGGPGGPAGGRGPVGPGGRGVGPGGGPPGPGGQPGSIGRGPGRGGG